MAGRLIGPFYRPVIFGRPSITSPPVFAGQLFGILHAVVRATLRFRLLRQIAGFFLHFELQYRKVIHTENSRNPSILCSRIDVATRLDLVVAQLAGTVIGTN